MTRDEIKTVCGEPDLNHPIPCFLILASDGLWDTVTNQEAVEMVSEIISAAIEKSGRSWLDNGALQEAAEYLTLDAYVRGSRDNIGICIVVIDV